MAALATLTSGCSQDLLPTCAESETCPQGSSSGTVGEGSSGPGITSGQDTASTSSSTADSSGAETSSCGCGPEAICVDDACVPAANGPCEIAWAEPGSSLTDTIRLGMLLPRGEPFTTFSLSYERAAMLWIEDFAELPGVPHPTWIVCDTGGSPEQAIEAAEHLATLGVVAVMGPWFSETTDAVDPVLQRAGVLRLSASVSSPPAPLVWGTEDDPVLHANAVGDHVALVGPDGGPGSAVLLSADDEDGDAWEAALLGLAEAPPPIAVRYPSSAATQEQWLLGIQQAVDQAWTDNGGNANDVIVAGSGAGLVALMMIGRWAQEPMAGPIPRIVLPRRRGDALLSLLDAMATSGSPPIVAAMDAVQATAETTAATWDEDLLTVFELGYQVRYDDETPAPGAEQWFDSAWTLSLLVCARADDPSGTTLAEVFEWLDGSGPVRSLESFTSTCESLAAGTPVTPAAVSGPRSWRPQTHLRRGDVRGAALTWPGPAAVEYPRVYVLDPPPAVTGTWMDQ
ncbi:MAG: ABC transporter substrate-binding protein [Nannocystaceae bacterium]